MTANVSIETESKQSVLRVPNAALRFKSATPAATPDQKGAKGPKGPGVWILENNKPKNVKITTGISDGSYTEVISSELTEGQQIITDSSNSTKKNEPAAGTPRFIR
jgi:HlyD family secretion protein